MKKKDYTLKTKLAVAFGIITVFFIISSIVSIAGINNAADKNTFSQNSNNIMFELKQREVDHVNWVSVVQSALISKSAHNLTVEVDHKKCGFGKWYYGNGRKIAEDAFPSVKHFLQAIEEPHARLHRTAITIKDNLAIGTEASQKNALDVFNKETRSSLKEVRSLLGKISGEISDNLAVINRNSLENAGRTRITVSIASIIGILFSILVAFFIVRNITGKLKSFMELFFKGARGDLTARYPVNSVNCSEILQCNNPSCPDYGRDGVLCFFDVGSMAPDFGRTVHCPKILKGVYKSCRECRVFTMVAGTEIDELGSWYNKFMENTHNMVEQIVFSSQNLAQAVEQIASGNENLSQRTTEQVSALEEIASTIEQNSSTINQNAENAINANKMSDDTLKLAQSGSSVVGESVVAIDEINASSMKIGNIISTINEIAFQTNLLALNASVEAARAGDQGRGFAVVAGEVRNLALRTAIEAKNIDELIKNSIDKVKKGTDLSNRSREAFTEIVEALKNFSKLIAEIASTTDEQNVGMDQVNTAVSELEVMSQQNAALVEETASAGEEMSNQAQELMALTDGFTLKNRNDQFQEQNSGRNSGLISKNEYSASGQINIKHRN